MKEYTKFFRNKLLKIVLSSFLFFGFDVWKNIIADILY